MRGQPAYQAEATGLINHLSAVLDIEGGPPQHHAVTDWTVDSEEKLFALFVQFHASSTSMAADSSGTRAPEQEEDILDLLQAYDPGRPAPLPQRDETQVPERLLATDRAGELEGKWNRRTIR